MPAIRWCLRGMWRLGARTRMAATMKGRNVLAAVRVGDVFSIPVQEKARAFGQVVAKDGSTLLVVTFRTTERDEPLSVEDAIASGVELAGIVFDAKFANGDWPIHENRPPVLEPSLWFVVGDPGLRNLRLVNFDESATRPCTTLEASGHDRRIISYPRILEMAVESARGLGPWRDEFEHMRTYAKEISDPEN